MNCPICGENTRRATKARPERCPVKTCPAQHIERNNRGDAWVWDTNGRLVHKPNHHPLPVDIEPSKTRPRGNDPQRSVGTDPTELPADNEWFQATPHGTTGYGRRVKEPRK